MRTWWDRVTGGGSGVAAGGMVGGGARTEIEGMHMAGGIGAKVRRHVRREGGGRKYPTFREK